ncbi:AAA-domain-containing protein [Ramaria rubella]|nr:AAA-domain-containing protein [Ramaria rubella]
MPRRVTVKYVSLRSSLVNLPISMYGPLVEHRVRPQSLAVHLRSTGSHSAQSIYVGWTGMAASSSLAQWQTSVRTGDALETIEIDPQFANSLGISEGVTLEIGLLHDLKVARSVSTEPVSSDDWEILELHAGYVEDNLLSQVRVACVGQEVDVWVLGRTRVRFRVVSYDPSGPAILLSTNTEVSIAPKLRINPASSTEVSSGQVDAMKIDTGRIPGGKSMILRSFPRDLLPSESCLVTGETILNAWVSPGTFSRFTGENPPPSTTSVASSHFVTICLLHPPVSPQMGSKTPVSPDAPTYSPATQTRIMHKGTTTFESAQDTLESTSEFQQAITLRWSKHIPDHHLFCLGIDGMSDWDLACVQLLSYEEREKILKATTQKPFNGVPALTSSSTPPVQTLAGVNNVLQECQDFVLDAFVLQSQRRAPVASRIHGMLLCGRSGSGKTSIAKTVVKRLRDNPKVFAYTLYIDLTKHGEERISVLKALFQYWLHLAKWHRPSLIVLDNLEQVIPAEVEHADSFRSRHLAEHFLSVFGGKTVMPGIVFIATCQSQSSIHPLLMATHIFSGVVPLKAPNKDARRDILAGIVKSKLDSSSLQVEHEHPLNFVSLATQTEGYLATDLSDLVSRALHQAMIRAAKEKMTTLLKQEDFESAQIDFIPLSLRDVRLQKSDVLWSDIGGLHATRRVLRETLEWPTKYGAIFASCPLRLRSGLLLYGFPGCGKTLLASAVAKECGLNFISVKGPELLNKYIGASEKSVRDLFDRASAGKPCILFFDEFDSIAPKRGHDSTGVTDRVVNQLLTQMDGAEGLDGVYVLAATSRPDLIDSALLRPGRLDKSLFCNMPDRHERKEILEAVSRKVSMASDVNLDYYAEVTEGFSGADLQALIYNAHLEVVHSTLENTAHRELNSSPTVEDKPQYTSFGGPTSQTVLSRAEEDALSRRLATMMTFQKKPSVTASARGRIERKPHVEDSHMRKSLYSSRPSVPPEERERLSSIYRAFVAERSGELPVPVGAGGIGNRASLM